jgi:hypothetical protein
MATQTPKQSANTAVPGLDAGTPYVPRLSSRSGLYTDFHQLLDHDHIRSSAEYRQRVVDENFLAKPSLAARARLWKDLRARYRLDADDPLFAAFWTEWKQCKSEAERGLTAYVLFALNDHLVADLGTEWLYPRLRRAPVEIRVADIIAFIEQASNAHPEVRAWSEQTRCAVAQKYAASIRDFGLARGTVRKMSIRPALYGAPIRLLVRVLRLTGMAPLELVRANAFKLLCLDTTEIIDALGEMNRVGALRFRMQADIVELDVRERA